MQPEPEKSRMMVEYIAKQSREQDMHVSKSEVKTGFVPSQEEKRRSNVKKDVIHSFFYSFIISVIQKILPRTLLHVRCSVGSRGPVLSEKAGR